MGEFIVDDVDWDNLFIDQNPNDFHLGDDVDLASFFDFENDDFLPQNDVNQLDDFSNNPSPPDSLSLSVTDMEQLLMNDDDEVADNVSGGLPGNEDELLSHWLNDSPGNSSGEVVDVAGEKEKDGAAVVVVENNTDDDAADPDDPISKKRKRQIRNRDAAVRSRERKKMYVKDLEMKSRYFEGECRRLGMLLQCYLAENQALRLSLQSGKACNASMTKQESAVLLLESLLLGSLLWFLGIVCLFIQPSPHHPSRGLDQLGNEKQESPLPRKQRSENFGLELVPSFFISKRCRASRSRMKPISYCPVVFG